MRVPYGRRATGLLYRLLRGRPDLFPGGDIGDLAINGTVNDLACCGARPLYLSRRVYTGRGLASSRSSAYRTIHETCGGACRRTDRSRDTKVVDGANADKLFINTSGIGIVPPGIRIAPDQATPGDVVICSGPIGLHGITILSARESLGFETDLKSDTASLNIMISELLHTIGEVHVLRDPTRGGVSGTLSEIAQDAGVDILLDEDALPIPEAVRAASEMLGLDPLYIANEGLVLVILPESLAEQALPLMRRFDEGRQATVIGRITKQSGEQARVKMKTLYGNYRIIDMLSGEQLPRIC